MNNVDGAEKVLRLNEGGKDQYLADNEANGVEVALGFGLLHCELPSPSRGGLAILTGASSLWTGRQAKRVKPKRS
jgi:hypothetical protein